MEGNQPNWTKVIFTNVTIRTMKHIAVRVVHSGFHRQGSDQHSKILILFNFFYFQPCKSFLQTFFQIIDWYPSVKSWIFHYIGWGVVVQHKSLSYPLSQLLHLGMHHQGFPKQSVEDPRNEFPLSVKFLSFS